MSCLMSPFLNIKKNLDKKTAELLVEVFGRIMSKKKQLVPAQVTFESFLSNKIQINGVIKHGVPYSYFESVKEFTPFNNEDWSRLLNVSNKTLVRYKTTKTRLKSPVSEKLIGIAEVTKAGLDAFGDMDKFKLWLDTPNFALGNSKPVELLENSYGKDLVLSELNNIEFGIFA